MFTTTRTVRNKTNNEKTTIKEFATLEQAYKYEDALIVKFLIYRSIDSSTQLTFNKVEVIENESI